MDSSFPSSGAFQQEPITPEQNEQLRLLEALFFASADPLTMDDLLPYFPGCDQDALSCLIEHLSDLYLGRGIELRRIGSGFAFRTAPDLSPHLKLRVDRPQRLSRAASETLAVIAYHQPVTRAEIEAIRGYSVNRGTLDILLASDWIMPKGRKRSPGRPMTWGTTAAFLDHFHLSSLDELPGLKELEEAGLIGSTVPSQIAMREEELEPENS